MAARQGYQLIAIGPAHYLTLAAACAASLRYWDGTRPIQLVTDAPPEALAAWPGLFDRVTRPAIDPVLAGPLSKLRAFDLAPFDETMFVDADCLLLKSDMDRHWARLSAGYDMTISGEWRSEGIWYDRSIAAMCAAAGIDRLAQMNSGAIYFKRTDRAHAVFEEAKALTRRLGDLTGHDHRGLGLPDEPYLALAFGILGIEPHPLRDERCDTWMTATFNSSEVRLDAFSGKTALVKRRTVSPSLCHFVGLFPRPLYDAIAADLLAAVRRGERA